MATVFVRLDHFSRHALRGWSFLKLHGKWYKGLGRLTRDEGDWNKHHGTQLHGQTLSKRYVYPGQI